MANQTRELKKVRLNTIIDNLVSAVVVLNRDTSILFANRMASVFADKPKEDLRGLRGGDAFNCTHACDVPQGCGYGPQCDSCNIRQIVDTSFKDRCDKVIAEAGLECINAGFRFIRLTTTYLPEDDIVILALEDLTDVKRLESKRLENEELLAAIETAGAVCHEINQPLQVISGYLYLMSKDNTIMQTSGRQIASMQDQIERLVLITRKLHALKRFSSKEYTKGHTVMSSAPA